MGERIFVSDAAVDDVEVKVGSAKTVASAVLRRCAPAARVPHSAWKEHLSVAGEEGAVRLSMPRPTCPGIC